MATHALLQYIAVAIITAIAIIVAIRFICRLFKSDGNACSGCALADQCNKKSSATSQNCHEKTRTRQ